MSVFIRFWNRNRLVLGIGIVLSLGLIVMIYKVVESQRPVQSQTKLGATWRGLTIGVSTKNDIHNVFGAPNKPQIFESSIDEYFIAQPAHHEPELKFYYDSFGVLSFIGINNLALLDIGEFIGNYGYPEYEVRTIAGYAYVYESQGIIVDTGIEGSDDIHRVTVVRAYFFPPCSIDCIMQQRADLFPVVNPHAESFSTDISP